VLLANVIRILTHAHSFCSKLGNPVLIHSH